MSDFIDLDDPFYAHETSSEAKGQTTTNVNIDALVTEKTTPAAVSGGNDVISDDDDDLELSGAGSGSGMDTDLTGHQLNITAFPIPGESSSVGRCLLGMSGVEYEVLFLWRVGG